MSARPGNIGGHVPVEQAMTRYAIQAREPGGPEVLERVETPVPDAPAGGLLVEVVAAGVNFIDTYRRSGLYPMPFPHVVGSEGAGIVRAVGADVDGFVEGDRVAWQSGTAGSYTTHVALDAGQALHVPDDVDLEVAAAVLLQGLTAHYLVDSVFPVTPGQDVLVHAGAGGVGLLLTQLARAKGARVLTTVSTAEKDALSRAAGAADVIRYDQLGDLTTELPATVRALTGSRGVHTVFDGVGRATFDASLASLRPRGGLALFGGASGPVPAFDPQRLNAAGSVYLTRPSLAHFVATRDELERRAADLFTAIGRGELDVRIGARFPLEDAGRAHAALERRATTGKVLLLP